MASLSSFEFPSSLMKASAATGAGSGPSQGEWDIWYWGQALLPETEAGSLGEEGKISEMEKPQGRSHPRRQGLPPLELTGKGNNGPVPGRSPGAEKEKTNASTRQTSRTLLPGRVPLGHPSTCHVTVRLLPPGGWLCT